MKKSLKPLIISLVLVIAVVATVLAVQKYNSLNKKLVSEQRTLVVSKGDISTTVTGSGPIISSNRMKVTPRVNSMLTKVFFKEGDKVKAGSIMYQLDETDKVADQLKLRNDLLQAKIVQKNIVKNLQNLIFKAPFDGQVTGITVEKGDIANKNAMLFTIADTRKLKLVVPFNGAAINEIKVDNKATVNLQNLMQGITGKVSYISTTPYTTPVGGQVYDVEITINNPGSLREGMEASALINTSKGTETSVNTGALTYIKKLTLRTVDGGEVKKINVKENQYVKKGAVLVNLQNQELTLSKQSNDLKVKQLESQIDYAKKGLIDYKVYAPISGTIVKQEIYPGDMVKSGDVLAIVADGTKMEFTIPVDELDIAKIKVGQKVNVTVDALPQTSSKPLAGKVSKIAMEGTSSNGVTTYPVTVTITNGNKLAQSNKIFVAGTKKQNQANNKKKSDKAKQAANSASIGKTTAANNNGTNKVVNNSKSTTAANKNTKSNNNKNKNVNISKLKAGMNANAEIFISNRKDVVYAPLEAVHKVKGKNYVMVKSDSTTIEKMKQKGTYVDVFNDDKRSYSSVKKATTTTKNNKKANTATKAVTIKNNLKKDEAYYNNSYPKQIEIGINDETSIEIISGLKEGETIVLPPITLGKNNANSNAAKTSGQGLLQIGGAAK